MPFVTVESKGGPHDDMSYTAGWEMGGLYARLEFTVLRRPFTLTIDATNIPQADLIAMKYGYKTTVETHDEYPEWAVMSFEPGVTE
jgi:hypothetical protein